jgi:two-component system response regulator LytT
MNVLIIEDEEVAYKNLVRLINEYDSSIRILDWKTTIKSSIDWFRNNEHPDLLFVDIHLPDGSAFDIFESVEIKTPVIFTTAYDEYAIKAFEINSIDYLLKPIKTERLKQGIDKYKQFQNVRVDRGLIEQLRKEIAISSDNNKKFKPRFLTKSGDTFTSVDTKDIAYFFADGNIVFAVTKNDKKLIVNFSLEDLENCLSPAEFFRATRKYLLHISSINKVSKYFNSRLKISINPPPADDNILVSRAKSATFLNWMEGNS